MMDAKTIINTVMGGILIVAIVGLITMAKEQTRMATILSNIEHRVDRLEAGR